MKRWAGLIHHTVASTWHCSVKTGFLNYSGPPSHVCWSNRRDTRRHSLHEVLRWKHSRDKMRKLKKELVCGRCREDVCACDTTFHSALEVCLSCGVFIGAAAAEMQASACCQEKGEHACVAVCGGVGSINRVIHSVLSLLKAGGTDHFLQLNLINYSQKTLNYSQNSGHRWEDITAVALHQLCHLLFSRWHVQSFYFCYHSQLCVDLLWLAKIFKEILTNIKSRFSRAALGHIFLLNNNLLLSYKSVSWTDLQQNCSK